MRRGSVIRFDRLNVNVASGIATAKVDTVWDNDRHTQRNIRAFGPKGERVWLSQILRPKGWWTSDVRVWRDGSLPDTSTTKAPEPAPRSVPVEKVVVAGDGRKHVYLADFLGGDE
jgi:hypothetical protein